MINADHGENIYAPYRQHQSSGLNPADVRQQLHHCIAMLTEFKGKVKNIKENIIESNFAELVFEEWSFDQTCSKLVG